MSRSQNTYNVNQIKQLIDLNNNKTNFELNFEVKSLNGAPFKALVISEADLNSGNTLDYKDVVEGYINGKIINDKGVYQNYFLLLKADIPTECEVILDIKDIHLNPEIEKFQQQQQFQQQQNQQQQQQRYNNQNNNTQQSIQSRREARLKHSQDLRNSRNGLNMSDQHNTAQVNGLRQNNIAEPIKDSTPKKSSTNWVLIIGICAIIGFGLWYFYNNKKKEPHFQNGFPNQIGNSNIYNPRPNNLQFSGNPQQYIEVPQTQVNNIQNSIPVQIPQPQFQVSQPQFVNSNPIEISPPTSFTQNENLQSVASSNIDGKRNDVLFSKLNNYFGI